jgi:putative transcriptional regulator
MPSRDQQIRMLLIYRKGVKDDLSAAEKRILRELNEKVGESVDKKLFGDLVESMKQMNEILQGWRAPSRCFVVDATSVKKFRSKLGLSQPKFAAPRNWEQGSREPTGPARALLTAISRVPEHVLRALAA